VADLPGNFVLPADTDLAVVAMLQSDVAIPNRGSLYLPHGMGRRGRVALKSYSAVLIEGDMDGVIDVVSYGYLHITGNLNGTVNCNSYATVVIDGNVGGLLRVRSYVTLYLGGRVLDPGAELDAGGFRTTFYFSSFTPRAVIESFPVNKSFTLQVRESDLSPGRHEGIGRWKEVIVGDPLWRVLH
jgi:hypothetical protein